MTHDTNPSNRRAAQTGESITVRPVRAAFGPAVSLVSVDSEGRLWVRFSTAIGIMLGGIFLIAVPLIALWWVSGGLIDSGQVNFDRDPVHQSTGGPVEPRQPGSPTELPLAR